MNKDFIEVRWHGRGGQGAKTASQLLAEAAILDGKHKIRQKKILS